MKEIELSSESLIKHSVDTTFASNCIRHIRCNPDWSLSPRESIFEIKGNSFAIVKAHDTQDNIRLKFVYDLVSYTIQKYNLSLNCRFILNTDDSVDDCQRYTRLAFCCTPISNHILIPDPHIFYHINTIRNTLELDSPFEKKEDRVTFFGTDSGIIDKDLLNQRIRFAVKAIGHPKVIIKITGLVHYTKEMLDDLKVNYDRIKGERVSMNNQLGVKYILNMDGNASAAWDRIPWVMASNCYLIQLKSILKDRKIGWYQSYMENNNILPMLEDNEILQYKFKFEPEIKKLQKKFSSLLLMPDTHFEYMKEVLIKYNEIYNG